MANVIDITRAYQEYTSFMLLLRKEDIAVCSGTTEALKAKMRTKNRIRGAGVPEK